MGHFKKKHIQKQLIVSILTSGVMLWILSIFLNNPGLFAAFKMDYLSIYASLIFFGFLFSPIDTTLSVIGNYLSRQYEYEADAYASDTTGLPEALISGLKKLCKDNLSDLTPHSLKVFFDYSHPPVLKRIEALRQIASKSFS